MLRLVAENSQNFMDSYLKEKKMVLMQLSVLHVNFFLIKLFLYYFLSKPLVQRAPIPTNLSQKGSTNNWVRRIKDVGI